jgi:hypothetical protein
MRNGSNSMFCFTILVVHKFAFSNLAMCVCLSSPILFSTRFMYNNATLLAKKSKVLLLKHRERENWTKQSLPFSIGRRKGSDSKWRLRIEQDKLDHFLVHGWTTSGWRHKWWFAVESQQPTFFSNYSNTVGLVISVFYSAWYTCTCSR